MRFFGENDPPQSARDRGLRLAELVRRRRTLMILDGLEPLQHPHASAQAGKVKDPAVAALIRSLAADNPGLLVVTTREPVADLESREGRGARSHDLERLSNEAVAALLAFLGVKAPDKELCEVAAEVRGHALTLTLLGTYLRKACHGDLRGWREMPLLEQAALVRDEHASRVMSAYVNWFGEGPERQILAVLGLFDRPADTEAVKALRAAPAIPSLTDELSGLPDPAWNVAVTTLREARLLLEPEASPATGGTLDAHPLVREHFGLVLAGDAPDAYRAGHRRLYEHYAAATDDLPATLEAMQPLFLAIGHGCRAGRRQEVYDEVYQRRVLRGDEFFSAQKLGAYSSELTAIAAFFENPFIRPSPELPQGNQGWLLNEAGRCLRALGRLREAIEPIDRGLQVAIDSQDWENAGIVASNLTDLNLKVGQVDRAIEVGRTSVELADRSGHFHPRTSSRSNLGNSLHAAGEFDEAESTFEEAEALQMEGQPRYPKLYSTRGYLFCDLLLSRSAPLDGSVLGRDTLASADEDGQRLCREVRERASLMFKWRIPGDALITIALDHLILGRATLGLALAMAGDLDDAVEPLNAAVHGLRAAGEDDELPRGLIARATLHRFRGDVAAAEADLEEALDIAERGSMRLFECDTHLEWARLRHSVDDFDAARRHLDAAQALVTSTGYRRREREVAELTRAVSGPGSA